MTTPTLTSTPALILTGEPRTLPLYEIHPSISDVSGKELRRFELSLHPVRVEEFGPIAAELQDANRTNTLITDSNGGQWHVEQLTTISNDRMPNVFELTATFREHETFELEALEFEGLRVTPTRAVPHVFDGQLAGITIQIDLDAQQNATFESILERVSAAPEAERYFAVQTTGTITDTRTMRFGQSVWEPREDGAVRHAVHLVLQAAEPERPAPVSLILEPVRSRLVDQALGAKSRMDALLAALREAGVLTQDVIDGINQASPSFADLREFDRTTDAELFVF